MEYKVRFKWRYKATLHNVNAWCKANCEGGYSYQYTAPVMWFRNSKDAMMFQLMLPSIESKQTESKCK